MPDLYAYSAQPQYQPNIGMDGALTLSWGGTYTAAALAVNKTVALVHIPKNSQICGLHHHHGALGANNGLTYGFVYADGTSADEDLFAAVADASTAGAGLVAVVPFITEHDGYLTVTKTGAGTATGVIGGKVLFNYHGGN